MLVKNKLYLQFFQLSICAQNASRQVVQLVVWQVSDKKRLYNEWIICRLKYKETFIYFYQAKYSTNNLLKIFFLLFRWRFCELLRSIEGVRYRKVMLMTRFSYQVERMNQTTVRETRETRERRGQITHHWWLF